jgi:hypothetical protein
MQRSSGAMLARADRVAARILAAVRTRPATVSGVPLQAAGVAIAEAFPVIADIVLDRVVDKPRPTPSPMPQPPPAPAPQAPSTETFTFRGALEPIARRLDRVKLPQAFLADLLQPADELHLADVAMRWAGMPNKNERAAMAEALDALTAAGFLEKTGDETWRVLRSAD